MLPLFKAGQTIVVQERWHGRLFAAAPHMVVASDAAQLVTYTPAGTQSVVASNFGLPGTEHLDRSQRKLLAMKSMEVWPRQISEDLIKLYVYTADRWSRVNLGWDPTDGRFTGWYVNFERPARPTADGIESKDLVLDLFVNADRTWQWKDRADFDQAMDEGVIERELHGVLGDDAQLVLRDLEASSGAFDPRWLEYVPPTDWRTPTLPAPYRPDGELWAWALPAPE